MLRPLFCLLFLLLNAPAHADEQRQLLFGHDDRQVVPTHVAPWQSLARIETAGDNLCSGALIAPHWVLSAGHCFLTPSLHLDPALRVTLAGSPRSYHPDRVYLSRALGRGLQPDGEGFAITPAAGPLDVALVHLPEAADLPALTLWQGSSSALAERLAREPVAQAGYPVDHPDTLLAHRRCRVERLDKRGMLEHRCDTLAGDSGSPLLLQSAGGWQVVGVQSSAPEAAQRERADNLAVAIPVVAPLLFGWMDKHV
ncbi:hypothetical protein ATO46_04860 [Aeromonas schubertii]|uniref:trypsin-like serine peptidase n=1 Tax=Aeromonas schubertii TaxID=652 RepID=UPI00067F4EC6|nr:trypsin-like serine protease [Aeromonas schubertii]KUE79364.1 hypothetical protein ATO46_04860 [Aeromonas schubertii]